MSSTEVVASGAQHRSHSTYVGAELIMSGLNRVFANAHLLFCLGLLRFRFEIRLIGCLPDAGTCVISLERFCGLDLEPYGIKRRKKHKREDRANGGSANEGVRQGSPKRGGWKGDESEHGSEGRGKGPA